MTTESNKVKKSEFEGQWKKRFESFASSEKDDAGIAGWSSTGLQTRLRYFSKLYKNNNDGIWLDAGCGAGTYSRYLASLGLEVIGFDYSLPAIQIAKQRNTSSIVWGVADVKRLPTKAESFDGSLCFGVTQALADSKPVLQELHRVVKPGAEVWVDGLNCWCIPHMLESAKRTLKRKPLHLRYESPWKLKSLMKDAGFVDVDLHWMFILPKRLSKYQSIFEKKPFVWLIKYIPLLGSLVSHSMLLQGKRLQ